MIEPTGYTALDLIGFTDKGGYDPTANYVKNDIVTVGNTKWRCKVDDTTGVTPAENANWTIYLESATSLAGMDDVTLTSPKNGDGLVHDGNDWKNIPIMTKEQWKKNGAYNLQPIDISTQVVNAVTVTVDKNGIKTQGVPSSTVWILYSTKVYKAGIYRFCGCSAGGTNRTYCLVFRVYSGADESTPSTNYYDTGNGVELTLTTNQLIKGWIVLFDGTNGYDGTVKQFKPMITTDLNATYEDYEPYAKTNGELTEVEADFCTVETNSSTFRSNYSRVTKWGKVVVVRVYADVVSDQSVVEILRLSNYKPATMAFGAIWGQTSDSGCFGEVATNGSVKLYNVKAGWNYGNIVYILE